MRHRTLQHKAHLTCHQAYNDYLNSLICDDSQKNTKKLYSVVKSKRNDSCGVVPLRRNGTTYSDAKAKANILNEQFISMSSLLQLAGLM